MIKDPARLQALLATIRQFVIEHCIPHEAEIDRDDCIPEPLVDTMRGLGLFGHSIPEAYGGAGLTSEELTLVNIEVSQAATTFRPLEVYIAAACIYLVINLCFAALGRYLEHRTTV